MNMYVYFPIVSDKQQLKVIMITSAELTERTIAPTLTILPEKYWFLNVLQTACYEESCGVQVYGSKTLFNYCKCVI